MTTGSVCDIERSGRPSTSRSPEVVDVVREDTITTENRRVVWIYLDQLYWSVSVI